MTTLQVDILNPKAEKLLEDLAELNLISLRKGKDDGFLKLINNRGFCTKCIVINRNPLATTLLRHNLASR